MQEVKINKAVLNERKELVVHLLIKEWDYTDTEAELLRQSKINWDLLDLKFTGLTSWDIEKHNKTNLVRLNWLMTTYCEKAWVSMQEQTDRVYLKYKVTSRRDISPSDIENEIEIYKAGLIEFN